MPIEPDGSGETHLSEKWFRLCVPEDRYRLSVVRLWDARLK